MKGKLIALVFSLTTLTAYAQSDLTVSSLAVNKDTKAAFQKMVGKQSLPGWVTQGGTDSQTKSVEIDGNKFLVLSSCKPHDCSTQRMAVLYSPTAGKMAGVFSTVDEKASTEELLWLNVGDNESIDGKTILYAALTGSLENHPDSFNFK